MYLMKSVKTIIETKKKLLEDLNSNIFSEFNDEEEKLLHSKHGYIRVKYNGKVISEGIVGAFKVGLPLVIDTETPNRFPVINRIDWNQGVFVDNDEDEYAFEFRPIKLSEL